MFSHMLSNANPKLFTACFEYIKESYSDAHIKNFTYFTNMSRPLMYDSIMVHDIVINFDVNKISIAFIYPERDYASMDTKYIDIKSPDSLNRLLSIIAEHLEHAI